jgi:pimeloyl-ACP methyl ester carboxylesterase
MKRKQKTNREKEWMKTLVIIVIVMVVIMAAITVTLVIYTHNNLHFDDLLMDAVYSSGFEEKQVKWNGAVINYAEGLSNGPPLVLIHGQNVEWREYAEVLPKLAKDYHVFAFDCFGHGKSAHDPALYTCAKNGEGVAWFIENIIGQPALLSGHSSGGIIAAWVAAYAPEWVSGLQLEDPPFFSVTPDEMQEGRSCFAWKDNFEITHAFINQSEEPDYMVYYFQHSYFLSLFGGLQPVIVDWVIKWRTEHPTGPVKLKWLPHNWFRGQYYAEDYDLRFGETFYTGSWFDGIDQATMLESIKCPIIYLKAETNYGKDGVLYAANTDDDAKRVMQCLRGASSAEMRTIKSGHDIHYEKTEFFITAIHDILE